MKRGWLAGALFALGTMACGNHEVVSPLDSLAADGSKLSSSDARKAELGRALFFDPDLSRPAGQSCATCHDPSHAFTDPDTKYPTSKGAVAGRFGVRNAPTAMYMGFSPPFHYSQDDQSYKGGQFWDGRASSLEQQAEGPLLNPLEMNNPNKGAVINTLQHAYYASLFRQVFGSDALDDVDHAYDLAAQAIAAFERTRRFSPFSSRYDAYLAGQAQLTDQEARGLALFEDPHKGNCAACHPSRPAADGTPPLFTDFTYDNLGIPKNPGNPYYTLPSDLSPAGASYIDNGLGGALQDSSNNGRFKVGTLRNIAVTAPYGHNGYFADLKSLVRFYNTRDVTVWPSPEVPDTVNHDELGNLGLTDSEEDDIVAFLGTLTDGYDPKATH